MFLSNFLCVMRTWMRFFKLYSTYFRVFVSWSLQYKLFIRTVIQKMSNNSGILKKKDSINIECFNTYLFFNDSKSLENFSSFCKSAKNFNFFCKRLKIEFKFYDFNETLKLENINNSSYIIEWSFFISVINECFSDITFKIFIN